MPRVAFMSTTVHRSPNTHNPTDSERIVATLGTLPPRSWRRYHTAMETPVPLETREDGIRTAEEVAEYTVRVGTVLLECGCPAYRVEGAVRKIAALEGYRAEGFALPTGLFLNVRSAEAGSTPVHRMSRVREWSLDLSKLVEVDAIFNRVAKGELDLAKATLALTVIGAAKNPYPRAARWLAVGAAGAASAVFFRGGLLEAAFATVIGLVLYGLIHLVTRSSAARFLQDFVYAFFAAVLAYGVARIAPSVSRETIVLAAIVPRVPGMTLTTGLAELAQKNLVAGGARLMDVLVTLLSLVLGVAIAVALGRGAVTIDFALTPREPLGLGFQVGALVVASLSYAVVFAVPARWLWSAIVSGAVGYGVSTLALRSVPPFAAAFFAALAVCVFANVMARWRDKPAQLFQIPGMMLLVPGTFGFLSMSELARGTDTGLTRAIEVLLVAGGLVIGVIGANAVVPPRKIL